MGVKEFFTGGPKVREAKEVIRAFKGSRAVPKNDRKRLEEAEDIAKRHTLKMLGVLGLGGAATLTGAFTLHELFLKPESDDEVRESYEDAFRKLAAGDPRGDDLIKFYDNAARKGHYEGEGVILDGVGLKGTNFMVAVVDADRDSLVLPQTNSAVSYNNTEDILTVKKLKLTDMWKGVVFAYGVSHAYDNLVGQVGKTDEEFYLGDVNAYEFGIRLLDHTTGGQLKEEMISEAKTIPQGIMMIGLSVESFAALDSFFPESLSSEEEGIRTGLYNIGVNFAAIESRYNTPGERKKQKISYLRTIYQMPIITIR